MVEAGLWASSWGGGPTPCSTSGTQPVPWKARRHPHKKHRIRGLEFGPHRGAGRLRFPPVLSRPVSPVHSEWTGDAAGAGLRALRSPTLQGRQGALPAYGNALQPHHEGWGSAGGGPGRPRPPAGAQVCAAPRPDRPAPAPAAPRPWHRPSRGLLSLCGSLAPPPPLLCVSVSAAPSVCPRRPCPGSLLSCSVSKSLCLPLVCCLVFDSDRGDPVFLSLCRRGLGGSPGFVSLVVLSSREVAQRPL